jgi:uncharacterized protein YndB with AHSA1/START domain
VQPRPLDPRARAVYDLTSGRILGAVELPVPPERAYDALIGPEVTQWWVNPGVFDTREWEADVRPGGAWRAAGVGRGQPYALEGEFVEVQPPRKLAHTWRPAGGLGRDTSVTYLLDPVARGTRLTLRHEGFTEPSVLVRTCLGWETSLEALEKLLSSAERK